MDTTGIIIKEACFSTPELQRLLLVHREVMQGYSPQESIHAIDINQEQPKNTVYYCAWVGEALAGCIALKTHNEQLAEIKSMKTSDKFLRKGVAKALLHFLIAQAMRQNVKLLALETGTHSAFNPAIELYRSFHFEPCSPFAEYREDPNSTFMELTLN